MPSRRVALGLFVAGAAVLAWVLYFRWKDKARPEPWSLMLATVAGGAGSVAIAGAWYVVLRRFGLRIEWEALVGGPALRGALAALAIGVVEEGAKLLPVALVALRSRHFDEPLDGVVYAACAGIGFATVETVGHAVVGDLPQRTNLLAGFVMPFSHALFAAPWGLGLARWRLAQARLPLVVGFAAAAGLHGAYDFVIARDALPDGLAVLPALALWVWLVRAVPRLAAEMPAS